MPCVCKCTNQCVAAMEKPTPTNVWLLTAALPPGLRANAKRAKNKPANFFQDATLPIFPASIGQTLIIYTYEIPDTFPMSLYLLSM